MSYRLRSLLVAFIVLVPGLMSVTSVQACSGGATVPLEALLEQSDIVVKAEPIAVDQLRQNGVLRVESYLHGTGPEYVLFSLNDPTVIEAILEGSPKRGCETIEETLTAGHTGVFFLARRPDGAYVSTSASIIEPHFYTFDQPDTTHRFYTRDGDPYNEHIVDAESFVDLVTMTSGRDVIPPDPASAYPRLAPIKITTADGVQYLLPIDGAPPVEATPDLLREMSLLTGAVERPDWNEQYFVTPGCPGPDCEQISPDGLSIATQLVDDVTWYWGMAPGQAFLFSSTSDTIAVWNEGRLTIYTLGYSRPDMNSRESQEVRSVTLTHPPESTYGQAAWSPDGRLLAYSDSAGLWLLDVFTPESEPGLLLESTGDAVPIARGFSPLARYLYVTQNGERFVLDYASGQRFPDGLVSPDDRLLLAFDTAADVFTHMQLCQLALAAPCEDLRGTSVYHEDRNLTYYDQFTGAAWRDEASFFVVACHEDDLSDCVVDRHFNEHGLLWRDSVHVNPGIDFDYQHQHDNLVILQTGNQLLINGEAVDLSRWLTEPIVSVEWLPSLFYER